MAEIRHRTLESNGIQMHLAEAGEGPPQHPVPHAPDSTPSAIRP